MTPISPDDFLEYTDFSTKYVNKENTKTIQISRDDHIARYNTEKEHFTKRPENSKQC
jgi:Fic family protein